MSEKNHITGTITSVNGPIVKVQGMDGAGMMDIAEVGPNRLIGEIIRLHEDVAIVQVYEDNTGLRPGDRVVSTGMPLSATLGPGIISNIYDGIQRPLEEIARQCGAYITRGVKLSPLEVHRKWEFVPSMKEGEKVAGGTIIGMVQETPMVEHRIMVPPGVGGRLTFLAPQGDYTIEDHLYTVENGKVPFKGSMKITWPVRMQRACARKIRSESPLVTGQRIIDTFFPLASGGTAAIPGGFGTGKTMTQHALAKWCNADIIVYIGCGERGNEMTEVLNDFPELVDPRTGRALMERTVMIANTSNMPVPAREVSIYTGVTIAEYYRDMGYRVAVMADSTSRWAEALRELSSRLEDMPAEEGFPPYLATRLAEFYERAGMVENMNGSEGSISIVGAVSPPGGDFSEPVTQHTTRFVRCFWALDKVLADARHYPSISWIESYSEYSEDVLPLWEHIDMEWKDLRVDAHNLLLEDNRLQQIVKLIGPDALPAGQRFVLFCAELLKNGYLQQNSFDPNDMFCTPEKQVKLLRCIMRAWQRGKEILVKGVPLQEIMALPQMAAMVRLKSEVSNDELDEIDRFMKELDVTLGALEREWEHHEESGSAT